MDESANRNRWDIYDRVVPPWETGRPQPAIEALAAEGQVTGRVLDIGCGTGEHALMAAALGFDATGIDSAPSAIRVARQKATDRGLDVRFLIGDALELASRGEQFDTVIDSSLFHTFSDADRPRYVASVSSAVPSGGSYHLLCFSENQPGNDGPRRVTQREIRECFATGWVVDRIDEAELDVNWDGPDVIGWLARLTRT